METKIVRVSLQVWKWLNDFIDSGVVPVSNRTITFSDAIAYLIGHYEGVTESE